MIDPDAPRKLKIQFYAVVTAFVVSGCFMLWLGLSALLPVLRSLAAGASMVEFSPSSLIGLPLALALFALAALAFTPQLKPVGRGKKQSGHGRAAKFVFGIVALGVLLTIIITPLARGVMAGVMQSRDYIACGATLGERHPPMRWVRSGTVCP